MKFVAKIKMKNSKIPETRKVKNAGSEYKKMAGEINDKVGEEHIKWRESEENGTTARNALANNRKKKLAKYHYFYILNFIWPTPKSEVLKHFIFEEPYFTSPQNFHLFL